MKLKSISLSIRRTYLGYRRRYRKVCRFVRILAAEVRDELYTPNYFQYPGNIWPDWPAYYVVYRVIRSIPRNIVDQIELVKYEYIDFINSLRMKKDTTDSYVKESKELYSELSPKAGKGMKLALIIYKESIKNFVEGYQDSLNGASFPYSEGDIKKNRKSKL